MICRLWHSWTSQGDAARYETLLRDEVFVGIRNRSINGFRSMQLLRRDHGEEVEFIVMMVFDSIESIKAFVGEDCEIAYVPEKARALLARFDERAQHYEVRIAADETTASSGDAA